MLIIRFLKVASLAYVYSLLIKMVSSQSLSAGLERGAPDILRNNTVSQYIHRTYQLYNQCSGRHVQIIGKAVNARGTAHSPNVNLSFVSVHVRHHPSAMNIVGLKSGRFLCFNKRGKLIARFNGKKRLCLFKEDYSRYHFTVIQSLYDPTWYIGFNRKGKPLKASNYAKPKQRKCFHFMKRNHSFGLEEPRRPGPPIKDPSRLKDLLNSKPVPRIRKTTRRFSSSR